MDVTQTHAQMCNMYRRDKFYADRNYVNFTLSEQEGFELCSQRFTRMFPGYEVTESKLVIPGKETRTVNLKQLISLLRSSDEGLWAENKWIFDKEMRFLDKEPIEGNKVCFTSIHRSGNTFMRQYLEMLTGVATGGDVKFNISSILQFLGSKGEEHLDDAVWIVKSHTPWAKADSPLWTANKVICIVRNPMDVIVSYLHRKSLQNHSQVAEFVYPEVYPKWWDWWVRLMADRLSQWYEKLLFDAKVGKVPFYFVRFEDLSVNPKPILEQMMQLLINVPTLEGTNAQRRVDEVIGMGREATVVYSLKDNTRSPNKNERFYNAEQKAYIKDKMQHFIYFFGYAQEEGQTDNPTGFYTYPKHSDSKFAADYYQFKNFNLDSIQRNANQTEPGEFLVNDQSKNVEVITKEESPIIPQCVINDAELRLFGKARETIA